MEALQKAQTKQIQEIEIKIDEVIKQHLEITKQVKTLSILQTDMAKQIINQYEETDTILKGLGLRKDLSYYSFNLQNEEGH